MLLMPQVDCQRLTRLRELRLFNTAAAAEEYEPLASLPALEKLSLAACLQLPDCLGRLPALRLLSIRASPLLTFATHSNEVEWDLDEERAELLDEALSTLSARQLTQLQLNVGFAWEWPTSLLGLRGLQALALERRRQAAPLPAGPWLRSLRWAVLSTVAAAVALPALTAATRLEGLSLESHSGLEEVRPCLLAWLAWAPQQPALRLLEIEHKDWNQPEAATAERDPEICAAVEHAQQAAPALRVEFGGRLKTQLLFTAESPDILVA